MNEKQTQKIIKASDAIGDGDFALSFKLINELVAEGVTDAEHFMGWFYE